MADNLVSTLILETSVQCNKQQRQLSLYDNNLIKFTPHSDKFINQLPLSKISNLQQAQGKPILKLILIDLPALIVSFTNPDHATIIKESIVTYLSTTVSSEPTNPNTTSSGLTSLPIAQELQLRADLLLKHRTLAKLHMDLVCQGHITETEFWNARKPLLERACLEKTQLRGHKSSKPPDVPIQTGDNQLKLTITPQFIHATFLQYPSVHMLYNAKVPHEMSEKEFWQSYARSQLFKNRMNQHGERPVQPITTPSMFDACYHQEMDRIINNEHVGGSVRSTLNIAATENDHMDINGNAPDKMMRFSSGAALLREFNQHSSRILHSVNNETHALYKSAQLIQKEVQLDDLNPGRERTGIPNHLNPPTNRSIEDPTATGLGIGYSEKFQHVVLEIGKSIDEIKCQQVATAINQNLLDSKHVTAQHSKGSSSSVQQLEDLGVPSSIASTVTNLGSTTSELLRHFWGATRTDPQKQKRLVCALRAQQQKVQAYIDLGQTQLVYHVCMSMLQNLRHALNY